MHLWNVGLLCITLMMQAVCTSETSVCYNETTWRNIPEGSKLHTRHFENLKSHMDLFPFSGKVMGTLLCWVPQSLDRWPALSKGPNKVGSPIILTDGNRSSFWNFVF
jgi:hypothetical protein